jgi:hypothetical protein
MEPVIFLDIDGVLNKLGTKERCTNGCVGISPDLCANLNRILEETGAKIVISSTWRHSPTALEYLWDKMGKTARQRCIGKTPNLDYEENGIWIGHTRGQEIRAWLESHPTVKNFVIIDDDGDMDGLHNHIQTDNWNGLTNDLADEAIRQLKPVSVTIP